MLNIALMPILAAEDPMSHVASHKIFEVAGFEVTNHHLLTLVAAVVAFAIFAAAAIKIKSRPEEGATGYVTRGAFGQFFEVLCEFIREKVARPALGELTDKYIYYIWSVFFFLLTANLLGMIPFGAIAALVTGNEHLAHWGGTATANLMVTGAMATLSLLAIVGIGIRENGAKYFAHFAPVPVWPIMKGGKWPMLPLALFLVVLELMGMVIKSVILAVRLFGNIAAGHLVIAAVLALIIACKTLSAGVPLGGAIVLGLTALNFLELFVAFLQAFIFTFLTVLFIAAGAVHHGDHKHEGHAEGAHH